MMKKILLICILLLSFAPHAVGSPQYAMQGVTMPMELLELNYNIGDDAATITETIVFRNNGDTNYSGDLHITIPENAEVMYVKKMGHAANANATEVRYERDGEILCWNTTIAPGAMAMYSITYAVPTDMTGTVTKSGEFVKKLHPAVMKYPITSFRLKVNTDGSIKLTDENGATIKHGPVEQDDSGDLYVWTEGVTFKELHVSISQPSNMDKWIVYGLIALLIIAALTYPIIHVRNNKLREKEGGSKLSCASCSGRGRDKENDKEPRGGDWDEMDEIITEISQTEEDLIRKKRAILAVLNKLEEDRDAGAVSDAEYKRISSKYEKQAIEIMKQLDQM